MTTDPIPALKARLAELRAQLYTSENEADTNTKSNLAARIYALKAQLDPLERAAGLLENSEDELFLFPDPYDPEPISSRTRKRRHRRDPEALRSNNTEIDALSDTLAGIIDPTAASLNPEAWMAGFRLGRRLLAIPAPR